MTAGPDRARVPRAITPGAAIVARPRAGWPLAMAALVAFLAWSVDDGAGLRGVVALISGAAWLWHSLNARVEIGGGVVRARRWGRDFVALPLTSLVGMRVEGRPGHHPLLADLVLWFVVPEAWERVVAFGGLQAWNDAAAADLLSVDDDDREAVAAVEAEWALPMTAVRMSPLWWSRWSAVLAVADGAAAANGVALSRASDRTIARVLGRPPRPEAALVDQPPTWFARQRRTSPLPPGPRALLVAAWIVVFAVLLGPVSGASATTAYPAWMEVLASAVVLAMLAAVAMLVLAWRHGLKMGAAAAALGVVLSLADFAVDPGVAPAEAALFLSVLALHSTVWRRLGDGERIGA